MSPLDSGKLPSASRPHVVSTLIRRTTLAPPKAARLPLWRRRCACINRLGCRSCHTTSPALAALPRGRSGHLTTAVARRRLKGGGGAYITARGAAPPGLGPIPWDHFRHPVEVLGVVCVCSYYFVSLQFCNPAKSVRRMAKLVGGQGFSWDHACIRAHNKAVLKLIDFLDFCLQRGRPFFRSSSVWQLAMVFAFWFVVVK